MAKTKIIPVRVDAGMLAEIKKVQAEATMASFIGEATMSDVIRYLLKVGIANHRWAKTKKII